MHKTANKEARQSPPTMDWNDIQLILAIGREGSISGAARRLGLNYSTVFRRLNSIEKKLDARLFDRKSNRYVITEAGAAVMRSGEVMEEEAMALSRDLLGQDLRLQGIIKLTSPEGVAVKLLSPLLASFAKEHPRIVIDMIVTSTYLKLSHREADIAVRCTREMPEDYIGKAVCKFPWCAYASTEYLAQNAHRSPKEQFWIMDESTVFPWGSWRRQFQTKPRQVFHSDSTMLNVEAAKQGMGIIYLPCFLGDGESGLVRHGEPPEELTLTLWILTHPDLRYTARVKALMGHLVENLVRKKDLIEGRLVKGGD